MRLLELNDVRKVFGKTRSLFDLGRAHKPFRALKDVSLTVYRQEIVGLVGESGCGKSTLAQVAIRLLEIDGGSVGWKGSSVTRLSEHNLRDFRRGVQMVFQDTGSSLNPRKSVERHLFETLAVVKVPRAERRARAHELLTMVGLDPVVGKRLPHELSGGQRQRLGIARALAMQPELIIADEPVASLDVSLQAQIVNLLEQLRDQLGLAMLFISHDLALVGRICDRVAVMFAGAIVEEGLPQDVLHAPAHPYTRALIDAIPRGLAGRGRPRKVHAEAMGLPDVGCPFAPRCPMAADLCHTTEPQPVLVAPGHFSRCHFAQREIADIPLATESTS